MSNPVIIRRRVQRDYTVLPNDVVRDHRLSWKALGLLVYVLSLPDNFRLRLKYLTNQKPTGRDGTRAGLKELEVAGYLTIRWERSGGRFAQVIWEVTDSPAGGVPTAKSPCSENPNMAFPKPEKPMLTSTNSQQELIEQRTTTTSAVPCASVDKDKIAEVAFDNLIWPSVLSKDLRVSAERILQDCPSVERQQVLNEIAGLANRGAVQHPLGLLRSLVDRAKHGQFVPSAALEYQRKVECEAQALQSRQAEARRRRQTSTKAKQAAQIHLAAMRQQIEGPSLPGEDAGAG